MNFAHFAHVWKKAGITPAQRYQQLWRELQVADELSFDYGFRVEHHFRSDESWMSTGGAAGGDGVPIETVARKPSKGARSNPQQHRHL